MDIKFWLENQKGRGHLVDPGIVGRMLMDLKKTGCGLDS
jgi:hypothetical protein